MLQRTIRSKEITLTRARALRQTMPKAEKLLWRQLRAGRFHGYKFRRQVPLGPFIADFFCREKKLVIELDGESHDERVNYDWERDMYFFEHGIRTLRIRNELVYENLEGVLELIAGVLGVDQDPSP